MRFRTALLTLLLLAIAAPAASAVQRGPCVVGTTTPRCDITRGTAPFGADDGDTLDVHVNGTPRRTYAHTRITGVQAMELSDYSTKAGECKAAEANQRVDELLKRAKGRVRLSVQNPESVSRRRPLRSVAVRIKGRYHDIGTDLIERGLAVWLPNSVETHLNERYAALTREAARLQLGVFDPDGCGAGYQNGLPMSVWVNADPPGADAEHLDQEYVVIRNTDTVQTLDLSGWWVRDSGLRRYTFGPGTLVAPSQTITVKVGRGTDTADTRFWGLKKAVFDNKGDGAFLFDPEGDIRASMVYPCPENCADPLANLVGVDVKPKGREVVTLTNHAAAPVSLLGYRLRFRRRTYAFTADDTLQPGEQLRLDVQGYPEDDVHGRKSWGEVTTILPNRGGAITLETFDAITVACGAWGSGTCS